MKPICLSLILSSLLAGGCDQKSEAAESGAASLNAASVSICAVVEHAFRREIEVQANVLASKQVVLMPKVPGEVSQVLVAEGDAVEKGQLLLKLDQKDFHLGLRQARSQLAAAQAGVAAAEAALETISAKRGRLTSLYDENMISKSAYEDVEGGQRAAEAQLAMARAQLDLAQVGLDAARNNLAYTEVRAPFDGIVGKRLVDEGAKINAMPPTPVLMVVDLSSVKVEGAIPERDLPLVEIGSKVEVFIDALGDRPRTGTVERVEPVVDPMSRTATFRVVLPNSDGELKAGMSARLRMALEEHSSPAVPDDAALRSELQGTEGWVFVLSDGRAARRDVVLGVRDGELREIVQGLAIGDSVIRSGQVRLRDGQPVVVYGAPDEKR